MGTGWRRLALSTNPIIRAEGKGTFDSLCSHYKGWRAHMERGNTRELLRSMDKYFAALVDGINNKEAEHEHLPE